MSSHGWRGACNYRKKLAISHGILSGGGKRIRKVERKKTWSQPLRQHPVKTKGNFGNGAMSGKIYPARHIKFRFLQIKEVMLSILVNGIVHSNGITKGLEESPSIAIGKPFVMRWCCSVRCRVCRLVKCRNDWISSRRVYFYFMEMNTRVQVEHPVWSLFRVFDIVKGRFALPPGNLYLSNKKISSTSHAIECRINAENPAFNCSSPGKITNLYLQVVACAWTLQSIQVIPFLLTMIVWLPKSLFMGRIVLMP